MVINNYNDDENEDEDGIVNYFYESDVSNLDINSVAAHAVRVLDKGIELMVTELQQISKTHKTKPDLYKQLAYFISERQNIINNSKNKSLENIKLLMLDTI